MGPVTALVEQPAEGVLHRAGGGGEDMRLDRRQVDDVLADEALRNVEAVGIDLVEHQELVGQIAHRVADVDPLLAFVEMDVAQPVRLHDVDLLVLGLAQMRVDDHGAVVAGVDQLVAVAVLLHGADHAFELPGRGGGAGEEVVPGDVDLQRRVGVPGDHVLVAGQVHQPVVVSQYGAGGSS